MDVALPEFEQSETLEMCFFAVVVLDQTSN
jgi:hypothetical protein